MKNTIRRFEDIEAWRRARALAVSIYRMSANGPFGRDFPLRDQIRRAAISVMSNVAEGFERNGNAEFIHFLSVAKGSCGELRAQLYLAIDLGYISQDAFDAATAEARQISNLIQGFISYLQKSDLRGPKFRKL